MYCAKLIFLFVAKLLSSVLTPVSAADYTVHNYPNPQLYDSFSACKNIQRELLCDPQEVLNTTERVHLAQLLKGFQNQTYNPSGKTICKQKGISLAIAISKQPITGSTTKTTYVSDENRHYSSVNIPYIQEDVPFTNAQVAETLLRKWLIDEDCHKAMLIVLPVQMVNQSAEYHFKQVPLVQADTEHVLHTEMPLLKQGKYITALTEIMDNIRKLILDKQNIFKGGSSSSGDAIHPAAALANPSRVSTDSSTLCSCSRWGSSNLFVTQLLASLLSWVLVVTVAFVVCITWKKFKMRGFFEILKTEEIHNLKDCEQAVYMKQISDCENN